MVARRCFSRIGRPVSYGNHDGGVNKSANHCSQGGGVKVKDKIAGKTWSPVHSKFDLLFDNQGLALLITLYYYSHHLSSVGHIITPIPTSEHYIYICVYINI